MTLGRDLAQLTLRPRHVIALLHLHLLQELSVLAPQGRVIGELNCGSIIVVLIMVAVLWANGGPPPPGALALLAMTFGLGDQVTVPGDHLEVVLRPGRLQRADVDVLRLVLTPALTLIPLS